MQGLKIDARDQDELKVRVESAIEKSLGIQIKTKAVKKLGPKTYLIELTSIDDKIKIMKNKSKLKEYTEEKVYINDDMTKEEREIQEKIRRKAKEERRKGKTVKIGFQKLVVEGEQWRWSREKEKWNREGREWERKREKNAKKLIIMRNGNMDDDADEKKEMIKENEQNNNQHDNDDTQKNKKYKEN
ncbi:hypothetical protein QE152_g7164 [Popillia japonica]|uniref:Uncharacterized protein n=1 Tax=Popillia japonica TaxID=7064 RepID=A0AAW1MG54_POPJA